MAQDYEKAIEIAKGIYWVGYNDEKLGLHANPYLIKEGQEAVLVDGGSRPDFSTVMMKILQTGLDPSQIVRLIYHHYDPDLCGSIPNLESIIKNSELEIISQRYNNIFIQHYAVNSPKHCVNEMGKTWGFRTGRRLRFINTPYSHSPGSFVTFDEETGTLFSSDIFGAYSKEWELYLRIMPECLECADYENCVYKDKQCFMPGIINFHNVIMTSNDALHHALNEIEKLPIKRIAPQHGSIIEGEENVRTMIHKLKGLNTIGIDNIIQNGVGALW